MFEVNPNKIFLSHLPNIYQDINFSGDGGLYAELIQNRAFQGKPASPAGVAPWTPVGSVSLSVQKLSQPLSTALPNSLNVVVKDGARGAVGFANPGWWGIDVKVQKYTGSFYVKGEYNGVFTVSLQSKTTEEEFGSVKVKSKSIRSEWVQHNFVLTPIKNASSTDNVFKIAFDPEVIFKCH
jgi:alpha-N-arabinofuranosidase